MNRNEAKFIIKNEGLKHYNLYDDHGIYPNEVSISLKNDKWVVFISDERKCKISEEKYDNESDALNDFIKRLRADKILNSF